MPEFKVLIHIPPSHNCKASTYITIETDDPERLLHLAACNFQIAKENYTTKPEVTFDVRPLQKKI